MSPILKEFTSESSNSRQCHLSPEVIYEYSSNSAATLGGFPGASHVPIANSSSQNAQPQTKSGDEQKTCAEDVVEKWIWSFSIVLNNTNLIA